MGTEFANGSNRLRPKIFKHLLLYARPFNIHYTENEVILLFNDLISVLLLLEALLIIILINVLKIQFHSYVILLTMVYLYHLLDFNPCYALSNKNIRIRK